MPVSEISYATWDAAVPTPVPSCGWCVAGSVPGVLVPSDKLSFLLYDRCIACWLYIQINVCICRRLIYTVGIVVDLTV